MTTIAVRAGVMASDSRATYESEAGGHRVGPCTKLYRRAGAKAIGAIRALLMAGASGGT